MLGQDIVLHGLRFLSISYICSGMQIDVSDDDEDEQVLKHSKQNETRALGRDRIVLGLVLRVKTWCMCASSRDGVAAGW